MDSKELITTISSNATLLPLVVGLLSYSNCNKAQRLFLLYLCVGFCIDFVQIFITNQKIQTGIYNLYAVTEICFIVWFIRSISVHSIAKRAYTFALYLIIPIWIICHFTTNSGLMPIDGYSKWFDGGVAITIAIMAAFEILETTQKHDNKSFQIPSFWFLSALFTYFFCTFFIFFLMETAIRPQIWFMHNLVNVAECVLLSIAYYTIYRARHKKNVVHD